MILSVSYLKTEVRRMSGRAGSWIAAGDRPAGERGSRFCRAGRQTGARSAHLALDKIGGTARPRRGLSRHETMGDPEETALSPVKYCRFGIALIVRLPVRGSGV